MSNDSNEQTNSNAANRQEQKRASRNERPSWTKRGEGGLGGLLRMMDHGHGSAKAGRSFGITEVFDAGGGFGKKKTEKCSLIMKK